MLSIFNALVHVQAGMQFCVCIFVMSEIHCAGTFVSTISIYNHYWCGQASVVRPLLVSSSNSDCQLVNCVFVRKQEYLQL